MAWCKFSAGRLLKRLSQQNPLSLFMAMVQDMEPRDGRTLRSIALLTIRTVPWGEDDSHVLPNVVLGAWNVPEFPLALNFGAAGLYWIEWTAIFCPFTVGACC